MSTSGGGGAQSGTSVVQWPLDKNLSAGSGDLFSGTSLDGGWSSLQSTALTATDRPDGALVLRNTGNTGGQDRGLKRAFSPAGDFIVTTRVNGATLVNNYQWCGVFVGAADPSDGASGNRLELILVYSTSVIAGVHLKFAKYAAGVETVAFDTGISGLTEPFNYSLPIWLRIKRVGSTLTAGYSYDGSQFIDHATTTTIAFTVNTAGLFIGEATATANIRGSFAYMATA